MVVGLVVGVVTGAFAAAGRAGLYATGLWSDGGASTISPKTFETPFPVTPSPEPEGQPSPVMAPAPEGDTPTAKKIAAKVASAGEATGSYSGTVLDVATGKVLFAHHADDPLIPASTTKLLSSAAALSTLGPETRFETTVVSGGKNRIVLVGGGDPYLAEDADPGAYPERASVEELAKATAKALKADGITAVTLGYDASLFEGTDWNDDWPDGYQDSVTRVSALWVDEGRVSGSIGPRDPDPAKEAAAAFARALKSQKISVRKVAEAAAKSGAEEIAAVESMPLELIVQEVLLHSDNDAAEVLLRQAAIGADRPGSFLEGRRTVRKVLTDLDAWHQGTVVKDGSGLSRSTKVPAETMAAVLRAATEEDHPELRPLLTGLPVAGVEGSLGARFFDDRAEAGRGQVRGKTGTLREVNSLAGYVRTRDGSLLVYAFLVNGSDSPYLAQLWLDRATASLATCGCR